MCAWLTTVPWRSGWISSGAMRPTSATGSSLLATSVASTTGRRALAVLLQHSTANARRPVVLATEVAGKLLPVADVGRIAPDEIHPERQGTVVNHAHISPSQKIRMRHDELLGVEEGAQRNLQYPPLVLSHGVGVYREGNTELGPCPESGLGNHEGT